jgi:protein gp37
MATKTSIEWTDHTWNPVTGCTRASAGCDFCYAVTMTRRLEAMGSEKYRGLVNRGKNHFNGVVRIHPDELEAPLTWKKPRRVFVNSMSDLFHPGVPDDFILDVFAVMVRAEQHHFQILTKRPERARELSPLIDWPENVWMGTSVEDMNVIERVDELRGTSAAIRFLSLEPLIGPLPGLELHGIDWVIVGGESGPKARPMKIEWVRHIRDTCAEAGVPFFFKQWGGRNKKATGRILDGQTYDEYPVALAA